MSTATTTGPVAWDEHLGAFRVTGFAEALPVLRGQGWSSDPRRSPLAPPDIRDMPANLLFADPPDHTRMRALLSPAFTPRAIRDLRPRVTAIVDAVLDGLTDHPDRDTGIDLLDEVAYPVALAVIAELLDVGAEGAQVFADQTPHLVRSIEINPSTDDLMASAIATTEVMLFLTPIIAERQQHPRGDFISALLAFTDQPDGLDLNEVVATCVLLLVAGHETTANLIANSTHALLHQPDQIPHLHADPERAVEELLRVAGPVKRVARTATTDHTLGDQHVTAGQAVIVDIQQVNRDPRRFPEPQRLDLARAPVAHLAFGGGPHFCLGAGLARLETTEALTSLFTRYPGLTLSNHSTSWRASDTFHALTTLAINTGKPTI